MQPEQNQNYWNPTADSPADLPAPVAADATSPPASHTDVIDAPLTWQASEFVHYEKSGVWFLALLGVAVVLLVIDYFLIKSWTFAILIIAMTFSVGVVARRPPRTVNYALDPHGIQIDEKHFNFHDFRAFGVVQEGAFYSLRLVPNKRFMPMVSVYFPPEQGEQIVDIFGSALPMENLKADPIDKLVEKIRF